MYEQLINVIILGIIQGVTEWLPISSSGHLIILAKFLGLAATPLFDILLHVGTLVVVIFFFRKEVKSILSAIVKWDFGSEYGKLIPVIIVATIPTAAIGLLYVQFLEDSLQSILPIGIAFIIGGIFVYSSRFAKEKIENVTFQKASVIGTAQGFAAFHGLSRSGVTISTALLLGLKRDEAFKFSFLLSIPAILGDLFVEIYKQRGQIAVSGVSWTELLIGVFVAMIVGYFALKLLSTIVANKKFHYFALYTWLLGATLIILALNGF